MPFRSVVHPEELALLTEVLNDHCARFDIPDGPERDDVATLILALFHGGKTDFDKLAEAIEERRAKLPKKLST